MVLLVVEFFFEVRAVFFFFAAGAADANEAGTKTGRLTSPMACRLFIFASVWLEGFLSPDTAAGKKKLRK